MNEPVLYWGTRMAPLGAAIGRALGVSAAPLLLERFPDGEVRVELKTPVARREVFIVQSLAAPIGEAALELLLLADAAWRAGAAHVHAVLPYFGYARQDRRTGEGQPLGAKVMARVVDSGRFARVIALDLHAPAIAGDLAAPVDHLTAVPVLIDALRPHVGEEAVIVSPDLGAVKLAERYARSLGVPLAVVHKQRLSATEVAAHAVVGDVAGRAPVIVDDMISTGATIVSAVEALRARGCNHAPIIATTHALLVGPAVERLAALRPIRVFVTDSVPLSLPLPHELPLAVVALAPLLARAIRALHRREPLGEWLSHA